MGPILALLLPQAELSLDRLLRPRVEAVEAAVAEGFPRFDADGDGRIGRDEFGRFMAFLTPGAAAGATAAPGWAARAFAEADGDASGALSRAELRRFLTDAVTWRLPPAP